jgi:hypothetical protein
MALRGYDDDREQNADDAAQINGDEHDATTAVTSMRKAAGYCRVSIRASKLRAARGARSRASSRPCATQRLD